MSNRDTFCSERFEIDYCVTVNNGQSIESIARDICVEQTVEIPEDCIPQSHYDLGVVGRVEKINQSTSDTSQYTVSISYRSDISSYSVAQFLNTTFGNISLKNNIRIDDIRIPKVLKGVLPGPSFGIDEIRKKTGVYGRPLTCTALKPVGLNPVELALMAYQFAQGGADIIKDDHGITDQPFARFYERVQRVHEATLQVQAELGHKTLYCPMLNDDPEVLFKQIEFCKNSGIEGILAAPMLIGCGMFAHIAQQKQFVLMAHPALCGTFFGNRNHGATPAALMGTFFKLLGADISIFPNAGGRFHFTQKDCRDLCNALLKTEMSSPQSFPAPAGGMCLEKVDEMSKMYGQDSVFIIGGNLQQQSSSLAEATKKFVMKVKSCFPDSCDLNNANTGSM